MATAKPTKQQLEELRKMRSMRPIVATEPSDTEEIQLGEVGPPVEDQSEGEGSKGGKYTRYRVVGGYDTLSYGTTVCVADEEGYIMMPSTETWYQDLITAGVLVLAIEA